MAGKFNSIVAEQSNGVVTRFGAGSPLAITEAMEAACFAAIPPPVPKLTRIIAPPNMEQRGDGSRNKSLENVEVRGFEQNIAITEPGSFSLRNVRTFDAWRSNVEEANEGQGLYVGGNNNVTISGFYAARNGWQPGKGLKAKNDRRHGIYANEGGTLDLEDFILSENASVGVQCRRVGKMRRGFIHRNSIGILALMQPQELEDIVIYGGSWGVPNGSSNWAGMVGLDLYAPVKVKDLYIVGEPNPPMPGELAGAKRYDGGAIKLNRSHGQYPNTPGGSLEASGDCVIAGWMRSSDGLRLFNGDARGAAAEDARGFRISDRPVDVDKDVRLILADLEANKLPDIRGAGQRLRDLVRGAVK